MPHSYICTPSIITIFSPNLPPHSSQCPPFLLFVLLIPPSIPASVLRVRLRISKVFYILNDILCLTPHKADSNAGVMYLYTTGKILSLTLHIFEIIKSTCFKILYISPTWASAILSFPPVRPFPNGMTVHFMNQISSVFNVGRQMRPAVKAKGVPGKG